MAHQKNDPVRERENIRVLANIAETVAQIKNDLS